MVRLGNRTYRSWENRDYRFKYLNFMKPHRNLWNMRPITIFANDTVRLDEDNLLSQHNTNSEK